MPYYAPVAAGGQLVIHKYEDLDRSGSRGANETGLFGFSFTISQAGIAVASLTTDATGTAALTLAAGAYTVEEAPQTGWWATDPAGFPTAKTVTVQSGQTSIVEFGNSRVVIPATSRGVPIHIVKYEDGDHDGVRDASEAGLAGWSFTITGSDGTVVATIATDARGLAASPELGPDTYTITEQAQAGWFSTDPGGTAPTKTVVLGSDLIAVSFGNARVQLPSTSTDPLEDGSPTP